MFNSRNEFNNFTDFIVVPGGIVCGIIIKIFVVFAALNAEYYVVQYNYSQVFHVTYFCREVSKVILVQIFILVSNKKYSLYFNFTFFDVTLKCRVYLKS